MLTDAIAFERLNPFTLMSRHECMFQSTSCPAGLLDIFIYFIIFSMILFFFLVEFH